MEETKSKFFSVMVVGSNPSSIMEKYDIKKEVEPYVKYKYLDAEKYKKSAIKILENLLENYDKIGIQIASKELLEERLKALKTISTFDYYKELTQGLYYNNNGDAVTTENKDGHWVTARIGRNFALPLKLKNGDETYSALKQDVDWELMHKTNQEVYATTWEMVMEGKEPSTEKEKIIYESMKDKEAYFSNFKNKEAYVNYSTSYWNYAYVDEKNGWIDINSTNSEEWINNFYDRFVKNIKDDELITIFECSIIE